MWNQVYNPFGNSALSTILAALPVVTLLVLIASGKVKAHIAAIVALIVANLIAIVIFTMPAGMSIRASILGAVTGFFPIGWIVLNVIFLYRLTVAKGAFETPDDDRRRHHRPPAAAPAHRLLVRRLLRGRLGLRHAGRGHRRDPHRPRLLAARRLRPLAHRQHRAGRLWRARHADRRPRQRHRLRSLHPRRDGRAAIAVLLADRAVLADLGLRRLPRHDPDLAGDPGLRRLLRRPAIPHLELHQSVDRRYRRLARLDGLPCRLPASLAPEGAVAVAGLAQQGRIGRDDAEAEGGGTEAEPGRGLGGFHPVDHRLRHFAHLGRRLVQGDGQSFRHLELPRAGPPQRDQQGRAGGGEADPGK